MTLDYGDLELSAQDRQALDELQRKLPPGPTQLADIWSLMDAVWLDLGCDRHHPNQANLERFYRHPVWLLNGLFTEQDPQSMGHRKAISAWIAHHVQGAVLDYGGGYGALAAQVAARAPQLRVDILEPYPHPAALKRLASLGSVRHIAHPAGPYDAVVALDVLEHVTDPLALLATMVEPVRPGGALIIANHFYPSIRCHLPATFHLRHTFKYCARVMGLRVVGPCPGSPALIYRKVHAGPPRQRRRRVMERLSRVVGPVINRVRQQSRS